MTADRDPRSTIAAIVAEAPPAEPAGPPPPRPRRRRGASKPSSQTGGSAGDDAVGGAGEAADDASGAQPVKRPDDPSAETEASAPPPFPAEDPDDLDLRLAFYPLTDLGNAERFRDRQRGKFLWCPAIGWLWWDGRRWAREGAAERVRIAEHETVRAIQAEAKALAESDQDFEIRPATKQKEALWLSDALRQHGRASEAAGRMGAISRRADAYLYVAPPRLDADPFKINVSNGTLVVRKSEEGGDYIRLKPHDPADLLTKMAPVAYDRAAACPVYDKFMAEVQPDAATRRFLHQWKGLSLTGDVSEQRLCVFWGKGKNGKSTFIDVVAHVAGDYSETVPIETFLSEGRGRNAGQATPDLAILPGVRHLRTSEPDRGAKLAEALIKLATGGEPIQARHLNRDFFKFYPQFKLTLSGNYRPQIVGTDEGIWRRVILVPWPYIVPADKRDPQLGLKLRGEASGILNRLLDGLRDWLDHGLVEPEGVLAATADYRRDSDPLGRFLQACLETAAGERVQSSELHAVFLAWAKANGAPEWSHKGMSSALKERGYRSKQSNVVWWLDVRLTKAVHDFLDHEGRPIRLKDDRADEDDEEPF